MKLLKKSYQVDCHLTPPVSLSSQSVDQFFSSAKMNCFWWSWSPREVSSKAIFIRYLQMGVFEPLNDIVHLSVLKCRMSAHSSVESSSPSILLPQVRILNTPSKLVLSIGIFESIICHWIVKKKSQEDKIVAGFRPNLFKKSFKYRLMLSHGNCQKLTLSHVITWNLGGHNLPNKCQSLFSSAQSKLLRQNI